MPIAEKSDQASSVSFEETLSVLKLASVELVDIVRTTRAIRRGNEIMAALIARHVKKKEVGNKQL